MYVTHEEVIHVWQARLAVHSTKRRHQSPEWTTLESSQLLHSERGYWISGLSYWIVFIHVV